LPSGSKGKANPAVLFNNRLLSRIAASDNCGKLSGWYAGLLSRIVIICPHSLLGLAGYPQFKGLKQIYETSGDKWK
jgi:hypothetical protein